MKIQLEVSEENEATSYPWWFIAEPISWTYTGEDIKPEMVAQHITGPYFSREEAEEQLKRRGYDYRKGSIVWCASGYHSGRYRQAIEAREQKDSHDADKCL